MASESKSKKSTKEIIFTVLQSITIILVVAALIMCILFGTGMSEIFTANEAESLKPEIGEVVDLKTLLSTYDAYDFSVLLEEAGQNDFLTYVKENASETELIHICYALYNTANANYKDVNACAYEVNSYTSVITAGMEAPVSGYRYCLKNGEEFFYSEYSIPPEDSAMGAIMSSFLADSSNFAKRQYGTVEMTQLVEQKALKPKHTEKDGAHLFEVDWSKASPNKLLDLPIFCASQDGNFSYTDIVINPRTIKTADIIYDSQQEVYTINLTLDCTLAETTENTISNVRESSGCSDAVYTSISEVIKIWNNGYFKYFLSVDNWEGNGGTGKMASTINFETNFFYDEAHLSLANYQYAEEFKEACAIYL